MQLDSYLEIFTTMYGWAFANIFGEAISGTGITVLPFALIVFNAWRESKEQGIEGASVLGLIDSIGTKLVVAMFVFSLCFATTPFTSLLNVNLAYTPPATAADPNPVTVSRDSGTGSTFDDAMADATNGSFSPAGSLSYVPAWWYTVMSVSSGFNGAVRAGIKNGDSELRMVEEMARNATISDPQLLQRVQRFYSECFVPARSTYLNMDRATEISAGGLAIIDQANTEYGPTDPDWMGSQLYRTEPGFYDTMRSTYPVPGFPVDFARDTDYWDPNSGVPAPNSGQVNPDWGRPYCGEWWLGLREDMINYSSGWQALYQKMKDTLSFTSEDQAKDALARLAGQKANPQFVDSERIMGADYDMMTRLGREAARGVSFIGVIWEGLQSSLAMAPLLNGLPMAQALVLMAVYMFLPIATLFSGYDLRFMFTGAIAIFSIKFCSVLWAIATWVDARMINAMYPGLSGNIIIQDITHAAYGVDTGMAYKRVLLNILLMMMFIGLPMIWLGMMGWIGVKVSHGVGELMNKQGTGMQNAGKPPVGLPKFGKK
jgi:F0F1-type ATP synthase assembly protein I